MALPLPSFARTIVANLLVLGVAFLSPPVQAASTTSTTLNSSSNPSIAGTAVTFTATVTGSAGGVPTGTMTLEGGGTSITMGALRARRAEGTIASGFEHTCALTSGGGVVCWGINFYGQLGDGTTTEHWTPVDVGGLTSGVVAIAAGEFHTCALTSGGGVKCWGANWKGQLGDGTTTWRTTAIDVSGLTSGVVAIAAGRYHTCAMVAGGGVKCSGANWYGELGDGTTTEHWTPVDVGGLTSGVEAIAAGVYGTCARTFDGSAMCWGYPCYGQASNDTWQCSTPVAVSGFSDPVQAMATLTTSALAVGDHALTAHYGGGDTYLPSTSSTLVQTVTKASTATSLAGSAARVAFGEALTLTATVTAPTATSGTVDGGSVVFTDATGPIATAPVIGGRAIVRPLYLAAGPHSIVATFQATAGLFASSSSAATVVVDGRNGAQFRVNSRTAKSQQLPAVAALKAGGYVVVWTSKDQDGSSWGIYGQRYKATGAKAGGEFRVNSTTSNAQSYPVIAATSDGGFVTAWLGSDAAGKSTGIRAQRWTAAGAKAGAEFRVDATIGTKQSAPSIAASPKGGFLVAWVSNTASGTTYDVRSQAYAATGKKLGGEVKVNATPLPSPTSPATVAALDNGTWGLAWTRAAKVGAKPIVVVQRLTAKGVRLGGEIPVTSATFAQSDPVATRLIGEGFVVAWVSQGQDGSGKGVFAQRYSAAGARLGTAFRINATTAADQFEPALATRGGGGFVAAWTTARQDGSGRAVYGRLYGKGATALGTEFRLNTTTKNNQSQPATAVLSDAGYVAVWTSVGTDGGLEGIYGQRFHLPAATERVDRTAGAARPRR